MAKGKNRYQMSPVGEFLFPWINKPDVKFNADGLFHVDLRLTGKDAADLREDLDRKAQEAFDEITAEMTPAERKKFKLYVPYEVEEDEEGNPTGATIFNFKQNAKIKLKDGSTKEIQIGIYDANGDDAKVNIYGGSTGRIMYSTRPIKMAGTKEAGVRLDFSGVQIASLSTGAGGSRFGKIEGGFVASKASQQADEKDEDTGDTDTGGDY